MEKADLVKLLSERHKIQPAQAEHAVNEIIAELAAPFVFKRPGEQVAFLDNSCRNNCKEALAAQEVNPAIRG